MSEAKQQKVVAFLSLATTDKTLILNGVRIATVFGKELCLCYNFSKKEIKLKEELNNRLSKYLIPVKNELPGLRISTLLISENPVNLPEKLADDYEAIFFVALKTDFRRYAKSVSESPVPFLFVDDNMVQIPEYKKLVMPLDLRKENTESALWCSYFGRFNSAEIIIVAANDTGNQEQNQVKMNVALSKKLFNKFEIKHKIYKGTKSSLRNYFEALEFALSSNSDLLVILGSSVITPLDMLIGLPEKKIIRQSENLPVLIINPRKDNYILCD